MRISNNFINYFPKYYTRVTSPTFKSNELQINLRDMPEGFVGKIPVLNNQEECKLLNLNKFYSFNNEEHYILTDSKENIIGTMYIEKNNSIYGPTAMNVIILRNHSNRKTYGYNINTEEYIGVGTRLLQIALKRSEEEGYNGNLELRTLDEAKEFYKKLGFSEANPFGMLDNQLYLTNKNLLKDKFGGLTIY